MYSIILIGALTIASGFIAYIGDILGRRLGKKRVTLWGLRPRHTAMLISIVTGIVIFMLTLSIVAAANRQARVALFQLGRLFHERDQLASEVENLRTSYRTWIKRARELSAKLKREQEKLKDAQRRYMEVTKELRDSQRSLARVQGELKRTKAELTTTRMALAQARRELKKVRKEIAKAEEYTKRSLATTRKQLDDLRKQVDELQAIKAELERYKRSLDAYVARMLVKGDLAYRADEVVAIGTVDGTQPKEQILYALERLLDEADKHARERGATGKDGERAVKVFGMLVKVPGQEKPILFQERDILSVVADNIREAGESVVVEVYARRNTVAGEQVPVDFRLYRNRLVFRAGDIIVRKQVNANASIGKLLEQLVSMLYRDVRRTARERGLLPRFNGERGGYGAISFEELGDVIEQLKSINGLAWIEVRAKEDTWTIGPLNIELHVIPM